MIRAVIATEDNNFVSHSGFDIKQIEKAIKYNKRGKKIRGASTISQQVAKNVFCFPQRTWLRKGIEAYFTVLIEIFWSKERIMEVYLNIIETGKNVYGVEAAAKKFYNKSAKQLNAHEASMIATALPNPRVRNIGNPTQYMVSRAAQVRRLMNNLGEIDLKIKTDE